MKIKYTLAVAIAALGFCANLQAQQLTKNKTITAGAVISEPGKQAVVTFITVDTLKITTSPVDQKAGKASKKARNKTYRSYTVADGDCVSITCAVGSSKIQLQHLDQVMVYDVRNKIHLIAIANESVIRLEDIKEISITQD